MRCFLHTTLFAVILCAAGLSGRAQIVDITANPSTSVNLPFGSLNYAANESIYTEAEIGASNFVTTATEINAISYSLAALGTPASFGTVNIYMKDVPLTTTTFTNGSYSTAGYTLVYSGSVAYDGTSVLNGFSEIVLTTPFTRTAGNNLQILITRTDGVAHPNYSWNTANGNNVSATANTTRRYNSATALSGTSTLTAAVFRPRIRLRHKFLTDAKVNAIFSLGKMPFPNGISQPISASITNDGLSTMTNIDVTLDISGANSFSAIQTIPTLAAGATVVLPLPPPSYTTTGTNTVTVSVANDEDNSNNTKSLPQILNDNTWSYAYGTASSGGVGFNTGTGNFVARFNTNLATLISQVSVNFNAGGQPFKIGIWDATGAGGTPGALIWESTSQTSTAGLYVLPVSPAVPLSPGDFFVGVRQTVAANVSFSFQTEIPIRSSTFFYSSPITSTTWIDFAPNSPFRFMIEPKLILPNDAGLSNLAFNGGSTASCSGGTQQATAVITNTGGNTINPGSASVVLKIAGANTYTSTIQNTTAIASGGTETVTFTGIPLPNAGVNLDTAYVVLTGDQDHENDTVKTTSTLLPIINTFPVTEGFDAATLNIGNLTQLSGTGNWALQNGNYTNLNIGGTLAPHSSTRFALFNSYNFAAGTASRLYSNCIAMPAATTGCNAMTLGFWMSHDASYPTDLDSMYVSVSADGGATWTRILPGYGRYNATFTAPGWAKETIDLSAYAGQTIQLGFEAIGKFGNVIALDDITIGSQALVQVALSTAASNNVNLVQTCTDQGWTYYGDPSVPNSNLLAINWDPNSTGVNTAAKAAAIAKIQLDGAAYSAQNTSAQAATITMKRYWNVDLNGSTMTGPVNVRFFYDSSDVAEVTTAVTGFITANGGTAETPTWFKTLSGAFANDAAHMDEQGVFNTMALTNVNTTNARVNGFPYAQFNGITSFSGGSYAAGVGTNTPLPTSLLNINAKALESRNVINWTMSAGGGTSHFIVEKSGNGTDFVSLERMEAARDQNKEQTYTAYDATPRNGINYYRVRIVDLAGNSSYSKTVSIRNEHLTTVSVYPNPVKDVVNININAAEKGDATIWISDVTGKEIYKNQLVLQEEATVVTLSSLKLAGGSYFVKLVTGDKTIVHKFSVQ